MDTEQEGPASPAPRTSSAIAHFVRDEAHEAHECHWLEWKSRLDLREEGHLAKVAKAILAFSNRTPDQASPSERGYAYFVVGTEPGATHGTGEPVDLQILRPRLIRLVGPRPRWEPEYVQFGEHHVLVVTIQPPRWGDLPNVAQQSVRDARQKARYEITQGTIYVRNGSETGPAGDADVEALFIRALRGRAATPTRQPDLEVTTRLNLARTRLRAARLGPDELQSFIARERCRLLEPLTLAEEVEQARQQRAIRRSHSQSGPKTLPHNQDILATIRASFAEQPQVEWSMPAVRGAFVEPRTPEVYRAKVASYLEELEAVLQRVLGLRVQQLGLAVLAVDFSNPGDEAIRDLEIVLHLPEAVTGVELPDESPRLAELPAAPVLWGTRPQRDVHAFDLFSPGHIPTIHIHTDVRRTDDGSFEVRHRTSTLRAHDTRSLLLHLLIEDCPDSEITVDWSAAATNRAGRPTSTLIVPVGSLPVTIDDLVASVWAGED